MSEIKNAKIIKTFLGIEDHGIMTCCLHVEFDSFGQAFGGHALDEWNEDKKMRIGTAYGMKFIMAIIQTLEVESWENLTGTYCRIDQIHRKILRIGNLIKEKWFDPLELK